MLVVPEGDLIVYFPPAITCNKRMQMDSLYCPVGSHVMRDATSRTKCAPPPCLWFCALCVATWVLCGPCVCVRTMVEAYSESTRAIMLHSKTESG